MVPVTGRMVAMTALIATTLSVVFGPAGSRPAAAGAGPCAPPGANPVACENTLPGNPQSEWDVAGGGDPNIQGFATDISVNHGDTVHFKVSTPATAYHLDVYRMGYYGAMGARKVATVLPSAALPQQQPACVTDTTTHLVDCGNWAESASWIVPSAATSGIYFAKLIRDDGTSGSSHVFFIVRADESHSDLLFQTSDTTWQAYNYYGGYSLYPLGYNTTRAYKVSYNRPFTTRGGPYPFSWVFNAEYPMVRWLEANGFDVSYFTGIDSDRRGGLIPNHKAFLSVGHDEYWSAGQRANVEAARAAGVNLAFFSGNESFWKTRWEPSVDGSSTAYRTLVTYKETLADAKIDPTPTWTGTWRDPRFSPPADGGRPENALSGLQYMACCDTFAIQVPSGFRKLRLWRNTTIATMPNGTTATLAGGTLGSEWDEDVDNGFRPPGLVRMSSTTEATNVIQDAWAGALAPGTSTHHVSLYRAPSGALVFAAGTIQWSWGLDGNHDRGGSTPDVRMQQATVNLLADMGARPATLQPGLVAASRSTDAVAPHSTISAPTPGTSVQADNPVVISGTARDTGGGVVGGVEVSADGGQRWHPATGTKSWSYSWTPTQATGTVTIMARAVDDSGNLETPGPSVTVTVTPRDCPCRVWSDSTVPTAIDSGHAGPEEVGLKFRTDTSGFITGARFYKAAANTGTHVAHMWSSTGALLATATFSNESGSGWQRVRFPSAVPVAANTTYVVSYHTDAGHVADDPWYFTVSGVDDTPLHALQRGVDGPNGVYATGAGAFPTTAASDDNYWVDVTFTP